jgi:hypothetical protein
VFLSGKSSRVSRQNEFVRFTPAFVERILTIIALIFFEYDNRLVVVLITLTLCKLLEDYRAERARVPPVRDKFSRVNARTLSGRLHTGKGRQTSQTTFTDVLEQESLQQVDRLQGQIRSNLFAYLHAAVLSHHCHKKQMRQLSGGNLI